MPVQSEGRNSALGAGNAPLHSKVEDVRVSAYTIPTDFPESDDTIAWDKTTIVVVEVASDGASGIGYTYVDVSTANLVRRKLAGEIRGKNCMDVTRCYHAMWVAIRNLGRPGIVGMAISAVDVALWDLKARLLGLPYFDC
jgi:L-alanine-DL-glutamate epimerase-like enolase superfamily enzyme